MAIVATAVLNRPDYKSWTLTALDADTTVDITHGFGAAPDLVVIQNRVAASATDGVNDWTISVVDATKLTVTKTTAAGSGGATPGTTVVAKVVAMLPHSML